MFSMNVIEVAADDSVQRRASVESISMCPWASLSKLCSCFDCLNQDA